MLEEDEEKYRDEIAFLQDGYLKTIQAADEERRQLEEKKVQQDKEYKEAKAKMAAKITARTPEEVAANIKAATSSQVSEKAGTVLEETKTSEQDIKE